MMKQSRWKRFKEGYVRFAERQGFAVIVTVCVAVITGTAVWTKRPAATYVAPTPPVSQDVSAAQLLQESLENAVTPSPAPTAVPMRWQWPVDGRTILQGFNRVQMVRSGVTGIWTLHDAVDLAVEAGEPIKAIADGIILAAMEEGVDGAWALVRHGEAYEALYAGMAMLGPIREGDQVRAGQTLGFGGNGVLAEGDLPPHLHLRIVQDGVPVDPISLLETVSR